MGVYRYNKESIGNRMLYDALFYDFIKECEKRYMSGSHFVGEDGIPYFVSSCSKGKNGEVFSYKDYCKGSGERGDIK